MPALSRNCNRRSPGARSTSHVAMSRPSRERERHHMASRVPRVPRVPRVLLALLVAALLAACQPAAGGTPTPASTAPSTSVSAAAPAYPLTLTDDAGNEVTLAADPQRIVSLAPSNTEIVCAVGACDELVGVTDFDDYPPQVADVEDVVVGAQVDVEKVVAAEPD